MKAENLDDVAIESEPNRLRESCVRVRPSLTRLLAISAAAASSELSVGASGELSSRLKQANNAVFSADGQSLLDTIELFCLAGVHGVFAVVAPRGRGVLCFDAGQIVHAETDELLGEPAALAILAWQSGSVTASSAPFPSTPSVSIPWQSLVLRAEAWCEGDTAQPR